MRVVVCPHSMEIGGSQLNAIELAAAVRDRGHDVWVYAEEGPMLDRVGELGLPRLARHPARFRPGLETARDLRGVLEALDADVVHGYEWPPILEAYAAAWAMPDRVACVGTVMSMGVAPFLPSSLPLAVGTAAIRERVRVRRRGPVELIEPPVDTVANRLDRAPPPPPGLGRIPGVARLVVVSRLAEELKLEGILTAIGAVGRLQGERAVELVVVGDGPARSRVRDEAERVNDAAGRRVVVLAGEHADPRWAYASADVCLAMGGSALRAMAFARPLVVQGEGGFFELLTPTTAPGFLEHGWFGTDQLGAGDAGDRLVGLLSALLPDGGRRARLGIFGRELVESRFALAAAAEHQEQIYRQASGTGQGSVRRLAESGRSGLGLLGYKLGRRRERILGRAAVDDFNAARAR